MKSETERRRHRRAVSMLGRLMFTTLGPLTLSLLFAAYSPPAHADTITVVGTPGVDGGPGTDGGPGGPATAVTPPNSDPTTPRTRQVEPAAAAVPLLALLPLVTEELAATPSRPPLQARPTSLAMVSLPRLPQAAQAAPAPEEAV
jgi:hypothetical protein